MLLGGGEGDKDDEVAGSEKVTEEPFGGTPSSSSSATFSNVKQDKCSSDQRP